MVESKNLNPISQQGSGVVTQLILRPREHNHVWHHFSPLLTLNSSEKWRWEATCLCSSHSFTQQLQKIYNPIINTTAFTSCCSDNLRWDSKVLVVDHRFRAGRRGRGWVWIWRRTWRRTAPTRRRYQSTRTIRWNRWMSAELEPVSCRIFFHILCNM